MFVSIVAAVRAGLEVVLKALGLWEFFAEKKARADERIVGEQQAAAEAALEAAKRKAEEESHREEVHNRSDADLDKSLDKLMRD